MKRAHFAFERTSTTMARFNIEVEYKVIEYKGRCPWRSCRCCLNFLFAFYGVSFCLHFRPFAWLRCVREFVCFALVWLLNSLAALVRSIFARSSFRRYLLCHLTQIILLLPHHRLILYMSIFLCSFDQGELNKPLLTSFAALIAQFHSELAE